MQQLGPRKRSSNADEGDADWRPPSKLNRAAGTACNTVRGTQFVAGYHTQLGLAASNLHLLAGAAAASPAGSPAAAPADAAALASSALPCFQPFLQQLIAGIAVGMTAGHASHVQATAHQPPKVASCQQQQPDGCWWTPVSADQQPVPLQLQNRCSTTLDQQAQQLSPCLVNPRPPGRKPKPHVTSPVGGSHPAAPAADAGAASAGAGAGLMRQASRPSINSLQQQAGGPGGQQVQQVQQELQGRLSYHHHQHCQLQTPQQRVPPLAAQPPCPPAGAANSQGCSPPPAGMLQPCSPFIAPSAGTTNQHAEQQQQQWQWQRRPANNMDGPACQTNDDGLNGITSPGCVSTSRGCDAAAAGAAGAEAAHPAPQGWQAAPAAPAAAAGAAAGPPSAGSRPAAAGAAAGGGGVPQSPSADDASRINLIRQLILAQEQQLGNLHPKVGMGYLLLARVLQQEGSSWSRTMAQRAVLRARQILEAAKLQYIHQQLLGSCCGGSGPAAGVMPPPPAAPASAAAAAAVAACFADHPSIGAAEAGEADAVCMVQRSQQHEEAAATIAAKLA